MNFSWQPGMTLAQMEKMAIQASMKFHNNNKAATARSLDICVRTLDTKLAEYAKEKEKEDEFRKRQQEQQRANLERQRFGNTGKPNLIPGTITASTGNVESVSAQQALERPASEPQNGHGAPTGQRVEPAVAVPAQQTVPMSKREEIQSVPQRQAPNRRNERNR